MPYINPTAARQIRKLREQRGLVPESLAAAICRFAEAKQWEIGTVDASTIREIENTGHIPGPRVRLVLALFFGTVPHRIWRDADRVLVTEKKRLEPYRYEALRSRAGSL